MRELSRDRVRALGEAVDAAAKQLTMSAIRLGLMLRQGHTAAGTIGSLVVLLDKPMPLEDPHLAECLADLEPMTDVLGVDRVAVGMQVHIALDVDAAAVQVVDLRDIAGEWYEPVLFGGEELDGLGPQALARPVVVALAPGAEVCVQVGEVGEGASDVEVVLDLVEGRTRGFRDDYSRAAENPPKFPDDSRQNFWTPHELAL